MASGPLIGEIAAAYGLHDYACTAFQRAVAAGSARRAYMLARAGWAAVQADNLTGASSLVAGPRSPRSPEAAFDVVTAFVRLTANALRSEPGSGSGSGGAMFGSSAVSAAPEPDSDTDKQLRDSLRRELARAWNPERPVDRDMRARIGAQIELTDPARSRRPGAMPHCRHSTARSRVAGSTTPPWPPRPSCAGELRRVRRRPLG